MCKLRFLGAGLMLAFSACTGSKNNTETQSVKDYSVTTLSEQSVVTNIDIPATIQGRQVIEIRPRIEGYIERIHVKEGANVKQGQLLFEIYNPQYEQELRSAEAAIKSAKAALNSAKVDYEKVKPLVEQDIVSKFQMETAQYTLEAREADLATAQATLANARVNLGYTFIRSPQNGVIGTIPYKVGALVNSTSTEALTTMSDVGELFAYISMNEKQLLDFRAKVPGKTLQDKLNTLPSVNLILSNGDLYKETGKLETASGIIDTETGALSFKASFPNTGMLNSGASAVLRIPMKNESALVIPQSATYEMQDKRLVYVLADSNKVKPVAITTTPTDDGLFFIVNNGLKTGDQVILNGVSTLIDGTKINPVEAKKDSLYKTLKR